MICIKEPLTKTPGFPEKPGVLSRLMGKGAEVLATGVKVFVVSDLSLLVRAGHPRMTFTNTRMAGAAQASIHGRWVLVIVEFEVIKNFLQEVFRIPDR